MIRLARVEDRLPVVYRTDGTCGSIVLSGGPELGKGAFLLGCNREKHKEIIICIQNVYIYSRHLSLEWDITFIVELSLRGLFYSVASLKNGI